MIRAVTLLVSLLLAVSAFAKPEQVSFEAADGVRVFGDIYRSAGGELQPIILLFHQAGGDARGEYTHIAIRLMENGYNVLAIDQRSGGDQFGGVNRTMADLERQNYGYCEAYPDLSDLDCSAGVPRCIIAWQVIVGHTTWHEADVRVGRANLSDTARRNRHRIP